MIRLLKINKIESFDYAGDVYNLELITNEKSISKDDLFWIDGSTGIVSHNCFAKDINAMIYKMKDEGIDPAVLEAAWKKNLEVRDVHDWAEIVGAVSDD